MKNSLPAAVVLVLTLGVSTATPARADGLAALLKKAAKDGLRAFSQAGKNTLVTSSKVAAFAAKAGYKAAAIHSKDAVKLLPPSRLASPITERIAAPVARGLGASAGVGAATLVKSTGKAVGNSGVLSTVGDALSLLWKHKGAVMLATGIATVAAKPELFVGAAKDVATSASNQAMAPIADSTRLVLEDTARMVAWPLTFLIVCVAAVLAFTLLRGMLALWRMARKLPPAS